MTAEAQLLTRGYAVELHEEDDGTWTVLVPDLPGAVAAAGSPAEAIGEIGEAIDAWITTAQADRSPIPAPSRTDDEYSGRFVVRLPKSLHRVLAQRASREGVSLNAFCVAALTQVATQGLVETEFIRAKAALMVSSHDVQSAQHWVKLRAGDLGALGIGETPSLIRVFGGSEDPAPKGLIDAMRGRKAVRA